MNTMPAREHGMDKAEAGSQARVHNVEVSCMMKNEIDRAKSEYAIKQFYSVLFLPSSRTPYTTPGIR